jgi:ABC-type Na+ efflux pump permease subunit
MSSIDPCGFMYRGIVAMAAQMTALVAGISVVQDREAGFLREILVSPLSRTGIVAGKALGVATVALTRYFCSWPSLPLPASASTPAWCSAWFHSWY